MHDLGCVASLLVSVGVLIGVIVLVAQSSARDAARRAEELQKFENERLARAIQIVEDFEAFRSRPEAAQKNIEELTRTPIGYHGNLDAPGGWLERASPRLLEFSRSPAQAHLVERFFHVFTFPAGRQGRVLTFIRLWMWNLSEGAAEVEVFQRAIDTILVLSNPEEAAWFYARALEFVHERRGSFASKAIALQAGRRSYASGRPDRTPTIYDEQAIANDIAARV